MNKIQSYQVFKEVAEKLSFTKAAESLNLTRASVSLLIQGLEDELKTKLLHRTTRKVSLTPEGHAFLDKCIQILHDIDEAQSMFKHTPDGVKGKIRIGVSEAFAKNTLIPLLPKFLKEYPDIELELSTSDHFISLETENIDCTIRTGKIIEKGVVEETIGQVTCINCVSKSYIKDFGIPTSLDELDQHKLIQYVQNFSDKNKGFEYYDGKKIHLIKMPISIHVNSTISYKEACLAGLGIAQIPYIGVHKEIKKGELIEVLAQYKCEEFPLKIIYKENRLMNERLRVFIQWLISELRETLE